MTDATVIDIVNTMLSFLLAYETYMSWPSYDMGKQKRYGRLQESNIELY